MKIIRIIHGMIATTLLLTPLSYAYSVNTTFHTSNLTKNIIYSNGVSVPVGARDQKVADYDAPVSWLDTANFKNHMDIYLLNGKRICHVMTFMTTMPTGIFWPSIIDAHAHSDSPRCVVKLITSNPRIAGEPHMDVNIQVS